MLIRQILMIQTLSRLQTYPKFESSKISATKITSQTGTVYDLKYPIPTITHPLKVMRAVAGVQ